MVLSRHSKDISRPLPMMKVQWQHERGSVTQQNAASNFLQLQDKAFHDISHGDIDTSTNQSREHFGPSGLIGACENGSYYSRQ